jgi:hypothetical protein
VSERIRVPAPAARTRTADSPCVVIEPPRCRPLVGTGVYVGKPPSVQRVIIRTVAAKHDRHRRFGNERRDGQ